MKAALIRLITGVQPRWRDCPPEPPAGVRRVYFANHTSHLDAIVIWASLPPAGRRVTRPVAAQDYWQKSPVRRYFSQRVFNVVMIDRRRVTTRNNPIARLSEALKDASLILFPEGTRRDTDDQAPPAFKPGLWHLARAHPGVELVPVYVENLNRVLPKGDFLFIPLLSAVYFGPPLFLGKGEAKEPFLARARQAVYALGRHEGETP